MKRISLILIAIVASFTFVDAQVEQIALEQTVGAFTTESLDLTAGEYQFNIQNKNVDHEVGFVLVPRGKYDQSNHIQAAYVKAPVATGKSSMTSVVKLAAGEYEYFCPLNPTEKYPLRVHADVERIQLGQVPGDFKVRGITLAEGKYQFEIGNNGVDHEVGFVLVPKGKYDASDHIKPAYVKAPVAKGSSELTGIVTLEAGMYEYFCPLNPTPKYSLIVEK